MYRIMANIAQLILHRAKRQKKQKVFGGGRLLTNDELVELSGISKRTLQRLRSRNCIGYKIIRGRCYYSIEDIELAIQRGVLYCSPNSMQKLRNHVEPINVSKHGTIG